MTLACPSPRSSQPDNALSSASPPYSTLRVASSSGPAGLSRAGVLSGRVEVLHAGVWGTVCDDFWTAAEAAVACEQIGEGLGAAPLSSVVLPREETPAGAGVPVWLNGVVCEGGDTELLNCTSFGWSDGVVGVSRWPPTMYACGHDQDAGVVCEFYAPGDGCDLCPPGKASGAESTELCQPYYYSEGWRPILPLAFVKAYPKLHALVQECWRVRRKERPNFDQIVSRLQGDIGDEIKRKEEPKIELYSKEDDLIYRNRMGKEDELSDSDEEEEEGEKNTRRGDVVSKAEHSKAMAAKDKAMAELKDKSMAELRAKSKAMRELQEKAGAEKKKLEVALDEKTAEAGRWGAVLQELKVASPEDLLRLAEAHKRVMEELKAREEREGAGVN
ncbi:hypothetical protein TeGR_g14705 [Tetraparma gracilis]|uniref:SRCR domain-containing protein n=1 Tax=Tetraparma gracilis TaxID=2962635 RepID=A0ABQ6MYM7_9STRA|nr:hypothetical protein TeGR_g14705 [Tetraparma gracilis]